MSAGESWTCCHARTIASFCPHFHSRDCILLPQSCLCPDSINKRCSSPHHVSKLSGLHSDIYSDGNGITRSHSKNTCNHLWSALRVLHWTLHGKKKIEAHSSSAYVYTGGKEGSSGICLSKGFTSKKMKKLQDTVILSSKVTVPLYRIIGWPCLRIHPLP